MAEPRLHRARCESANLRVLVGSPDASAAATGRQRPRLSWWLAAAFIGGMAAVPLVAAAWIRILGIDFSLAVLGHQALLFAGGLLAANVVTAVIRNLRGHKDRARRVSVWDDGLRFDRRRPVPWSNVLDPDLAGPMPDDPERKNEMVWSLHDGVTVRVPLAGSWLPPEEVILAARSYLARTP